MFTELVNNQRTSSHAKPKVINRRILVVDDLPCIHESFVKILCPDDVSEQSDCWELFDELPLTNDKSEFHIDCVTQGQHALERVIDSLSDNRPYAMAFVDMRMPPGWNGVETIHHLWEVDPRLEIVICTAFSDHSVDGIINEFGETDQLLILKKPFDPEEVRLSATALTRKWQLARRVEQHCNQLKSKVCDRERDISDTQDVAVFALAQLAESRDPETGEHLARMRAFSQIIAQQLSINSPYSDLIDESFLQDFYRSTPLHDIGKVGIPDSILLKPGALTENEFEVMKRHTLIGSETLDKAATECKAGRFLRMATDIARYHHERYDGKGYPFGIHGDDIPLAARIVAVADVFDAITSKRVYKDAMPTEQASEIIKQESGSHFDPVVVQAFLETYDTIVEKKQMIDCQRKIDSADHSPFFQNKQ